MTLTDPTYVDDRLAHWAERDPGGEAITYLGRTWTWSEWDDRVRRVAGGLQALGIGRGDEVAFLDKNHPACVELSLGAASLGAANAIVNWRSAGRRVRAVGGRSPTRPPPATTGDPVPLAPRVPESAPWRTLRHTPRVFGGSRAPR